MSLVSVAILNTWTYNGDKRRASIWRTVPTTTTRFIDRRDTATGVHPSDHASTRDDPYRNSACVTVTQDRNSLFQ